MYFRVVQVFQVEFSSAQCGKIINRCCAETFEDALGYGRRVLKLDGVPCPWFVVAGAGALDKLSTDR